MAISSANKAKTENNLDTETLKAQLNAYRQRVEQALDRFLPGADQEPKTLHQAMRYSTLNGGKRIRGCLVYATGEALGASAADLDAPACAVELTHAYSLIHDDMPCMDNDDLRRGKPTCHKAYDDATALLVGDSLQTLAFEILGNAANTPSLPAEQRLRLVQTLAHASGSQGMAGGQAIDLASVGKPLDLEALQDMHNMKTGALIRAAVKLGALASGKADDALLTKLDRYGHYIGLAFQVVDDILDIESDTETMGKPQGSDAAQNKPTYPALLGMEQAKQQAQGLHQQALESLTGLGEQAQILAGISEFIVQRSK